MRNDNLFSYLRKVYGLLFLTVLPIIFLALFCWHEWVEVRDSRVARMEQIVSIKQEKVARWFRKHSRDIRYLAALSSVRDRDKAAMAEDFRNFARVDTDFINVEYVNNLGLVEFSLQPDTARDLSDIPCFQAAMRGEQFISKTIIDSSSGKRFIAFSSPVLADGGKTQGVVVGITRLSALESLIHPLDFGETGKTYLVDSDGIMLTASRFANDSSNETNLKINTEATRQALAGGGGASI